MKKLIAWLSFGLLAASPAFAQGDSSADAEFGAKVGEAAGVVLKVPINERGEELTEAAELRLDMNGDVSTSSDLGAVFDDGVVGTNVPELTQNDIDQDSSTSGWYSWHGGYLGHLGWYSNYYYSYRPSYYHCGYRWNFGLYNYRNYYSYYNHSPYYGYRYYYYNRWWH